LQRIQSNPLNLFLKGESSIGKTYNVTETLKYFPEEDVWYLGRLSPTALIHERGILVDENGEPINFAEAPRKGDFEDKREYREARRRWNERIRNAYHLVDLSGKILVFLEAPPLQTFNMLLPILSHDKHEIDYRITEKTSKGQLQTLRTVIRGWPATIFCTTSTKYLDDLATRTFTVMPETTHDEFKEANLVTAQKNACPWLFDEERFELRVIRYLINNFKTSMKKYSGVVVPYAEFLAENYFAEIGRDMRDFKNFLEYIKVLTALHFVQRPELQIGEKRYIVSQLTDFVIAQKIFFTIFESTRTNLPKHVLDFYHKVLLQKETWETAEAVEAYNKVFNPPKTSKTIQRYFEQLSDVGYVDIQPHPNDKRKNIYVVFQREKWTNRDIFKMSLISNPDLKKTVENWLEKLGHEIEFYIKNIDDVGNIFETKLFSKEEIVQNILLYKTDLCPNFINRISSLEEEKSHENRDIPEMSLNVPNSEEKKLEILPLQKGVIPDEGPIPLSEVKTFERPKRRVLGRGCYDCIHFTPEKEVGYIAGYCNYLNAGLQDVVISRFLREGCDGFKLKELGSLQDKINAVLEVLEEMEHDYGVAKKDELITRLSKERDIPPGESEEILGELIREGKIFEPRPGYLKKT